MNTAHNVSTPPPHDWSDDFTVFTQSATAHDAEVAQQQLDNSTYHDTVVSQFFVFCKSHTPEEALLYFIYNVACSIDPNNGATIVGLQEDQMGVVGKSFKVTANDSQLSSDLQNQTSDPKGTTTITQFATELDTILYLFDPKHGSGGSAPDPSGMAQKVQASFDPNSSSSIFEQLSAIRNTINIPGDTSGYNPTDMSTVYFDPNGEARPDDPTKNYLTSFADMQADMGKKGDPGDAVEASQALTNANTILTSTTQTANSALNTKVSQLTGFEKNFQATLSSLIKSLIDWINAILQNITSKSS